MGAWQIQPATDNKKALVKPCKSVENNRKKNSKDDISTQSTTTTPKAEDETYKGYVEKNPTEIF